MALSNSKRFYKTNIKDCKVLKNEFVKHFEGEGYNVSSEDFGNDLFLSITKGGTFQSIAGLKTGLNINIKSVDDGISVEMEVGIFGKQAAATAITALVAWPMIIPQIIGLIKQNKLDEEAYSVIERNIKELDVDTSTIHYCENCGAKLNEGATFCTECGVKINNNVCPKCNTKLPVGSKFCPSCGGKITQ